MNERAQSTVLCFDCRNAGLDRVFNNSEYAKQGRMPRYSKERIWRYGSKTTRCLFCALMIAAYEFYKGPKLANLSSHGLRMRFSRNSSHPDRALLHCYDETSDLNEIGIALVNLGRVDIDSTLPIWGFPRWPVPPLLNTPLLHSWLHLGGEIEGAGGRSMRTSTLFEPHGLRLLDCMDRCITSQFEVCQYLALSYVWGPPDPDILKTVTQNLSLLSQKDSLAVEMVAGKRLPQVIRDAIQLVVKLGFRYLWVDALCIVQDSFAEQQRLIDGMDRIYESAYATIIIPGCQNSDCAIPGVSTERPKINEMMGTFFTEEHRIYFGTYLQDLDDHVTSGSWEKRGWTLQEQLLSRRCLYLTKSEAFFYGNNTWFRESMQPDSPPPHSSGPLIAYQHQNHLRGSSGSQMTYSSLVKDYTKRELTHASDILRAFSGIYSSLCHIFSCKLPIETTNGILPNLLPKALLWTCTSPEDRNCQSDRRSDTPGNTSSTWAWCSRVGRVRYGGDFRDMFCLTRKFSFGRASSTQNCPTWVAPTHTEPRWEDKGFLPQKLLLLHYWPERRADDHHVHLELRAGELGFWAPCIRLTGGINHFFAGHARSCFASNRGFLNPSLTDFGLYGGMCFDDCSNDYPNELVVLIGMPDMENESLFETPPCETILGLAVRTSNGVSTRLGLFELFYGEPHPDDENANRRHRNWLEFVASDKTELYWRFVVLQ